MNFEILIKNIRELCKVKGIAPTSACIDSGAGKDFIANMIKGRTPSVEKVQTLADYLGVTTSELLGEKIPPVSNSDTSDTNLLASCDEETKTIITLLNQLDPENLKKAQDHLDYLLAKQAEQEGKK